MTGTHDNHFFPFLSLFLFLNLDIVHKNLIPEKIANIWQIKIVAIRVMKFEAARIHNFWWRFRAVFTKKRIDLKTLLKVDPNDTAYISYISVDCRKRSKSVKMKTMTENIADEYVCSMRILEFNFHHLQCYHLTHQKGSVDALDAFSMTTKTQCGQGLS